MVTRTLPGARLSPGASLLISAVGPAGCAPGCPRPRRRECCFLDGGSASPGPVTLAEDSVYFRTLRPLVCLFLLLPPPHLQKCKFPKTRTYLGGSRRSPRHRPTVGSQKLRAEQMASPCYFGVH